MVFSRRSDFGDGPSPWSQLVANARREPGFLDLTLSNPTAAELGDFGSQLRAAFASAPLEHYMPSGVGPLAARQLIGGEIGASPGRLVLTASTSEAYSLLFRLLCDPGDSVLVPTPSYPLFDHLAQATDVEVVRYPLRYDGEWHADTHALGKAMTPSVRAVIDVSPNNPTGSSLGRAGKRALANLGVPIITDEVFSQYRWERDDRGTPITLPPPFHDTSAPLSFALDGLSKRCGLPQMKLEWIAASGEAKQVEAALDRLDTLNDSLLSVSTATLAALPNLFAIGSAIRGAIQARLQTNLAQLRDAFPKGSAAEMLKGGAGWSAVVRLPELGFDWPTRLLAEGLVTNPGWLFDLQGAYVVLSLLTPPHSFREGTLRIATCVERECG